MTKWHWNELLPVDRYIVRTVDQFYEYDQKVLTLLYQPLIGALAHSLYLTLWSELESDQYWGEEATHRNLITLMNIPLDKIYEERKKLEGIGLLKTYKKKDQDEVVYLYEMHPPMTAHKFFHDDVLSVYLYNRLGKKKYLQTRDRFLTEKVNKEDYQNITLGFDHVFSSLHHSEIVANHYSEMGAAMKVDQNKEVIHRPDNDPKTFDLGSFDFGLLIADLPHFIDEGIITNEVKEAIVRLAFVYRVEPLEMSRILQQALLHHDQLDLEELRKKVQDWYRIEHGGEPPSLALRTQPAQYRTLDHKEPVTEEERMIKIYETESPLTLLESKTPGAKVPLEDVKIVESLLMDYKLLPGVANVLIDYVLMTTDMKLPKQFVHKIAGHWSRKKLKTVKEAMEFAKQEHQSVQEWKQNKDKKKPQSTNQMKYVRKDTLPKWFKEEEKKKETNENKQNNADLNKEKQRLEMMISKFNKQKRKED
ncbi:replication initiation and membrane attachment family protein [Anaerobacillus sp. MEB173]|uniref:replication initiation and membrane attachment family protein n=1 Tax=Anaerobacillus sp. MEB173 TaxID=3383345 RepID=UPI003F910B4F